MRAPAGSWADVSVSEYYTCVRAGDGQAACWGIDDEQARPGPAADVRVAEISQLSRVEVSWTGTPLAAPITSFDVEFSHRDPLAPVPETEEPPEPDWTPWLQGTTDRSATFEATGGGTWCFRARAHDADGITGGSLGMGCTSVPLDDRELDAVADWTRVEGPGYSAGTALRATAKGATIRISNGPVSSIGILGTRCGGCGTFLIGGDEVDLKGPFGDSVMVAAGNNGQEGYDGPVDIVVTSSGKPVIIDAIYLDLPTE